MSGRSPTFSASAPSLSASSISLEKLLSESLDDWFSTTRRITAGPPRLTRTSVTGSAIPLRLEIASRCASLLVFAIFRRSDSASRWELVKTGPAIEMSSSCASWRTTATGALPTGANWLDSSARALVSISAINRLNTSSNRRT